MSKKPVLALTMGDPNGIGPEVCVKASRSNRVRAVARLLFVGSPTVFGREVARLPRAARPGIFTSANGFVESDKAVGLMPCADREDAGEKGKPCASGGRAAVECIKAAVRLALDGTVSGLVTAPISKEALALAGFTYPGHTELLGELCNTDRQTMLLVGGGLRVALVTTHLAIRDVPKKVTVDAIVSRGKVLADALRDDFGLKRARIGVLALNPHGSDGGRFGDEEEKIITPAIGKLTSLGVDVSGPVVPDIAFLKVLGGKFDAVLCMYHDQGLIPLKTLAFETGVNVTLGLPIVRTSPDHGTAFDIAGKGKADVGSMIEAILLAADIAKRRAKRRGTKRRGHR